jgi:hypothetical protein
MAISGQEPIRIGQPNQSANSDSLYQAFNAIQNNFTTVFNTASNISTVSAGNGIQVTNTGNGVIVTNSGVTRLVAGDNVTITNLNGAPGANGALVISSTGTGGNGGGSVTSVGIVSNTLSVIDTPVIGAGNISVNLPTISGVAGSYRNPNVTVDSTGRVISIANGSVSGTVTSVSVQAGNGVTVSGSPITSSGTITVTNTGVTSIVAGPGIAINQSNGAVTITNTGGGGSGGGTVTRVGVISNTLAVTGSPIITSGNISIDLPSNITFNTIAANTANISSVNSNSIRITRSNSFSGLEMDTFSNDTGVSRIVGKKSRGTPASPSSMVSGDFLFGIRGDGYTAFNVYQPGSGIDFRSTGLPVNSTNFIPSRVILYSHDSSNNRYELVLNDNGNVSLSGGITSIVYSNVSGSSTKLQGRSRGTVTNISPVQVGDSIFRENYYGYTGNGSSTLKDVPGFSFSAATYGVAVGLPTNPGQFIPTDYYIRTTSNSNIGLDAVFSHTGNFTIPGSFNGNSATINGNIISENANLGNLTTANFFAGTLTTSSQPNITQIGTLSSLSVTGNVNAGNVTAPTFTGNLIGNVTGDISGNIAVPGVDSSIIFNDEGDANGSANFTFNKQFNVATLNGNLVAGNANLGNSAIANFFTGTLTTASQPNVTSVGTLGSLSVTGNVNAGNMSASLFTGTLTTAAQPNITSVGTLSSLSVSGNVNAGNVNAVLFTGTLVTGSQPNITSVGTLSSLSVSGNINAGNVNATLFSGTLVTGSQPNITSVGTLANLTVTGNVTVNGVVLTGEVTANSTATITATYPIIIDGITYQLMLTQ